MHFHDGIVRTLQDTNISRSGYKIRVQSQVIAEHRRPWWQGDPEHHQDKANKRDRAGFQPAENAPDGNRVLALWDKRVGEEEDETKFLLKMEYPVQTKLAVLGVMDGWWNSW